MRKKILNHTCILVVVSVLLTFLAAGLVMYGKYNEDLKESVRDSLKYVQDGVEKMGNSYLDDALGKATSARITLLDPKGNVLFDSLENSAELENHSNRPEFIQAEKEGYAETLRYSETLSKQNFYCAVKLADGDILRVGRTTDSVFYTMLSSSVLLGGLLILIFAVTFILVRKQTKKDLIEPINTLNLEEPHKDVAYEELRPPLGRVDQQNKQIAKQMEELKEAEAVRREFSANVSHELKTPLMSISGYAELMMNGMVPDEKVPEFSGRIYHEASRLSALVADIIQLSRLDEKNSDLPFELVDLYELAEDIVLHLDSAASKKNINVSLEGNAVTVQGVRHVIYEMLYNIADNAIRYTDQNGTVNIFTGTVNGHAFYRVEDNGIGIPENEQKRIFERFYRVDKSHSRATGGTGLGLSIVKHGAILHNAEIKLESEPGKGTKMELVF